MVKLFPLEFISCLTENSSRSHHVLQTKMVKEIRVQYRRKLVKSKSFYRCRKPSIYLSINYNYIAVSKRSVRKDDYVINTFCPRCFLLPVY